MQNFFAFILSFFVIFSSYAHADSFKDANTALKAEMSKRNPIEQIYYYCFEFPYRPQNTLVKYGGEDDKYITKFRNLEALYEVKVFLLEKKSSFWSLDISPEIYGAQMVNFIQQNKVPEIPAKISNDKKEFIINLNKKEIEPRLNSGDMCLLIFYGDKIAKDFNGQATTTFNKEIFHPQSNHQNWLLWLLLIIVIVIGITWWLYKRKRRKK